MNVELVFPTAIGFEKNFLKEEERVELINNIYLIKDSVKTSKDNNWLSGNNSPFNTIFTHDLTSDDRFSLLIDKVTKSVYDYSSVYQDSDEYFCESAWINVYQKGNFQEPHTHPTIRYSAVYFPKAPEGSGAIVFQRPYIDQFASVNVESNFINSNNLSVIPEENSLIVFPSSLTHFVLPGDISEDRISIAFNFVPGVIND